MYKVIYFFTALIIFVLQPEKYSFFNHEYNFFLSLVYLFLVTVFLFQQRMRDKNWLRFDVVFLLGYTIVHFQIPFLASIGIEPSRPSFVWINKEVVNYATWMSTVTISLWMLGYSLFSSRTKVQKQAQKFKVNYTLFDPLLIIVFTGFLVTVGKNFLSGAYDVNSWGDGATYFLLILEVLLYLRVIYFFKEINSNSSIRNIINTFLSHKLFVAVITTYTLLFFLTGSRGEILRILLVTAFAYSIYIKSLSFRFIIISVLIGSFIFTIMGLGRGRVATDLGHQSILQRGYTALQETDKRDNFTEELASSVRIQYRAIDTVPESHPYLYGLTYVGTIVGAIPFASGFVISALDIPYCYKGSASFFTCLGQGNNITYGEGSEILADIYINFSIYGVFIIMLAFGAFIGKATIGVKQKNFNYILIYAMLLIAALSINRGTILYAYKDIIYILVFHYILSGQLKWRL